MHNLATVPAGPRALIKCRRPIGGDGTQKNKLKPTALDIACSYCLSECARAAVRRVPQRHSTHSRSATICTAHDIRMQPICINWCAFIINGRADTRADVYNARRAEKCVHQFRRNPSPPTTVPATSTIALIVKRNTPIMRARVRPPYLYYVYTWRRPSVPRAARSHNICLRVHAPAWRPHHSTAAAPITTCRWRTSGWCAAESRSLPSPRCSHVAHTSTSAANTSSKSKSRCNDGTSHHTHPPPPPVSGRVVRRRVDTQSAKRLGAAYSPWSVWPHTRRRTLGSARHRLIIIISRPVNNPQIPRRSSRTAGWGSRSRSPVQLQSVCVYQKMS